MAGVVVVTLVALVAFDVGAVTTMRRYLLAQTDKNLQVALNLTTPRLTAILSAVCRGPASGSNPRRARASCSRRPEPRFWRSPAPSTWRSCRSTAGR